ncbi:hypothetical protein E2562_010487 [Oryza meyeriana var. granulata]|uniref:Uncharacterized protein n=1 Tax=Oryza meyeriana var. granulata TaxID=110450 RepID=A0A6G1F6X3_9ORYZ|nr:hypothetical protein E2562_010487 [Oryza meyeriana var. granulata]
MAMLEDSPPVDPPDELIGAAPSPISLVARLRLPPLPTRLLPSHPVVAVIVPASPATHTAGSDAATTAGDSNLQTSSNHCRTGESNLFGAVLNLPPESLLSPPSMCQLHLQHPQARSMI